jgi:hypothetical protein
MANSVPEIIDGEETREALRVAGQALEDRIFANGREAAIQWMIDHKLFIPPEEMEKIQGDYYDWQPVR